MSVDTSKLTAAATALGAVATSAANEITSLQSGSGDAGVQTAVDTATGQIETAISTLQAALPKPALTVSPTSFTASVGQPFTGTMSATGGTGPYTYTDTGAPLGLSFASGAYSGTFATAGTFTDSVTATDSSTPPVTATVTVTFTAA